MSRQPRLTGLALAAALFAAACSGQAWPGKPDKTIPVLSIAYEYTCGVWRPDEPPVERTYFDLGFTEGPSDQPVPDDVIARIEAAGGRIIHRFNGQVVRVEMPVARVISTGPWWVRTTADPARFRLEIGVFIDHAPDDDELRRFRELGGNVIARRDFGSVWHLILWLDDDRLPELRAMPGVQHAYFYRMSFDCVTDAG
ncbi:MAG: hypothetical protein R2752_02230 [Vicinamibacterales bacterium]